MNLYVGLFHDYSSPLKPELGPAAAAAHLQSTDGTVFRDIVTTCGRVPAMSASSGGQVLKQESRPEAPSAATAVRHGGC